MYFKIRGPLKIDYEIAESAPNLCQKTNTGIWTFTEFDSRCGRKPNLHLSVLKKFNCIIGMLLYQERTFSPATEKSFF